MSSIKSYTQEAIRIVLPLIILAVGVAGFAAISNRREAPVRELRETLPPLVETVAIEPHDGTLLIEVDGVAVPYREIGLSAEVAGRVTYKAPECRAGRYVTQGTLLVEIDPRHYELDVERLTQEVNQADATLAELDVETRNTQSLIELAEEQLRLQQRDLDRAQRLFDRGVATDTDLDAAKRSELSARNNLVTLQNQLQMSRTRRNRLEQAKQLAWANLEQAKLDLEHTQIRAPVDGVIIEDSVEENSYVQPGTLLATVEDTSAIEVQCQLTMEELDWLWRQQPTRGNESAGAIRNNYQFPETPATVVYRLGGRSYAWDGVLSRYDGLGVDQKTRTVPSRVLVENPGNVRVLDGPSSSDGGGPQALMRGMYVRVQVHARPEAQLLRVPERAVRPGDLVWCVRDGRMSVLPVQVARLFDGYVLLSPQSDGLQVGDRVVVSPVAAVQDGMPVREETAP